MTGALRRAREAAYWRALESVEQQSAALSERIARAEIAGDYKEVERLRDIADSCHTSHAQYRSELQTLTGQQALNLGGRQ